MMTKDDVRYFLNEFLMQHVEDVEDLTDFVEEFLAQQEEEGLLSADLEDE